MREVSALEGPAVLRPAAIQAISQWRYAAFAGDGETLAWTNVEVRFRE